jgi:predicted metal-binding membrane protein
LIVLTGLAAATVLAWAWIVPMGWDMYGPMNGPAAWMMADEWNAAYAALLFAMWALMMTGMMLPSAAPTILLYAAVSRRSVESNAIARAYTFTAGYLVVWIGFAAAAVAIQGALSSALFLTPMLELSSRRASSAVLALAGLYQLTPFKLACLSACQSPAVFIARHWRNGAIGALRMGMADGIYCLGCCWALMLLLFVGGVMHLPTIGLIMLLVLLEKLVPWGERAQWFTVATGSLLLVLAAWMLV